MKRKTLYVGLSLLVTIGVFSFIFTHVSLREVLDLILNCNRFALGIFIVLSLLMSLLRMWRYRLVLNTSGYHPSSTALYLVVLVRNLFSDLLPARIGSLVYIYIITNRLGIPFAPATSSFTLSLLFDIIAIAPMILVASLFCAADIGIPPWILTAGAAVIGAISLAALMAITPTLRTTIRLITASRRSQQGFGKKLLAALSSFQIELERAREAGIYWRLLLLSCGVRALKYGALYVLLVALVAPLGITIGQLSVHKVFVGLCAAELAASLPISGIAGFGAYEGMWVLVFGLLGFESIAKITSVSHHLFTQVYGYGLGVLALLVLLLPMFNIKRQDD